MSDIHTGGPAFPCTQENWDASGMTLRDYFAAKAMAVDMADGVHEDEFNWVALRAYKMADAMIKAKETK
jgi:hypothetical protein